MDEPTANSSSPSTACSTHQHPLTSTTTDNPRMYEADLRPVPRTYFPSNESLASSALWSSTDGSSAMYSGGSDLESDSDYSSESSGSSFDEEEFQEMLISPRGRRPPVLSGASLRPTIPPPPMSFPATEGLPFGGPEGLPFTLESLKKDLEKVGRAIIASNAGEKAAERAQTLASINWLASHVPNAVLDKLGHEIRDTLDHDKNGDDENSQSSDGSTIGVDRMTDIISDDAMSEVSELSNLDDEPSHEEEETMKMVEPADVTNVGISYGDLATFAHTPASSFLPEEEDLVPQTSRRSSGLGSRYLPEIDEINPSRSPLHHPSMSTMGSILDALPMKNVEVGKDDVFQKPTSTSSILDMIPSKRGHEGTTAMAALASRKGSMSTVTTASSTASTKQSKKKGVKGLLRRFKKGKSDPVEVLPPPPPPMSPLDVPRSKLPNTPDSFRWYGPQGAKSEGTTKRIASTPEEPSERMTGQNAAEKRSLPYSTKYRCALLFVDISGFTKLSRLLDPESLSKVSRNLDC
jgi:hypothetical protein